MNNALTGIGGAVAEGLFEKGLCLPSGTAMRAEDIARVVGGILATDKHGKTRKKHP